MRHRILTGSTVLLLAACGDTSSTTLGLPVSTAGVSAPGDTAPDATGPAGAGSNPPGTATMPSSGTATPGGSGTAGLMPSASAPGTVEPAATDTGGAAPVDGAGLGSAAAGSGNPSDSGGTGTGSTGTGSTDTGGTDTGGTDTGGTDTGTAGTGGTDTGGTDTEVPGFGMPGFGMPGFGMPDTGGTDTGGTDTGTAGTGGTDTGTPDTGGAEPGMPIDCNAEMPTSGAQQHSGNGVGGEGNLSWEIWSNTGQGELTTYDVPAFTASWNEAGGYLGRLGYEWGGFGETPGPYESHGTITAQFASRKSGTAGQYSYVGMYGWSTDPCVEWYVVDDSYNNMPINPGNTTNMGEVDIDGGTYIMYTRPTTGTGGTRCSGVNEWMQYYSVRRTARECGQISLTEHFDAWKSLGMQLGNLLEAKIIVEVGGGSGRVDLPVANVMTTP